ncbi:hypothetical protein KKHLCK_13615 [Candidatus Electrothrix laxa]
MNAREGSRRVAMAKTIPAVRFETYKSSFFQCAR